MTSASRIQSKFPSVTRVLSSKRLRNGHLQASISSSKHSSHMHSCRSTISLSPSHISRSTPSRLYYTSPHADFGFRRNVTLAVSVLVTLGVGVAILHQYVLSDTLSAWPPELREDLKQGLMARQRGDWAVSQQHLARVWNNLLKLPRTALEPELFLKTSGLLIVLADVFLQDKQPMKAYWMYALAVKAANVEAVEVPDDLVDKANECLASLMKDSSSLTESTSKSPPALRLPSSALLTKETRIRLIALTMMISTMCQPLKRPLREERDWLYTAARQSKAALKEEHCSRIVDFCNERTSLRFVLFGPKRRLYDDLVGIGDRMKAGERLDDGLGLPLPVWTNIELMAAPYERLAQFLQRVGQTDGAVRTYQHAIFLLEQFCPAGSESNDITLCQKARIYNECTFAMLIQMRHRNEALLSDGAKKDFDEGLASGRSAHQSFTASMDANQLWGICGTALASAARNLGLVYESEGELDQAKKYYSEAVKLSEKFGLPGIATAARKALRGVEEKIARVEEAQRIEKRSRMEEGPSASDTG